MIKEFNLYNDIIILEESTQKFTYIGSPLLEDDDQQDDSKKGLLTLLKDKILGLFGKDKGDVQNVSKKMEQTDSKKVKSPKDFIKWFGSKIMTMLGNLWSTILKAFRVMWNWIKNHVPGVNTIVTKVSEMLGKKVDKDKEVTVGGEKLTFKEMVAVSATGIVLMGSLGYILKKVTTGGGKMESTMVIATKPLSLIESDGSIQDSFVKKAPTMFGKLLDFMKNVKDAATKFIITTLGIMIGVAVFMLLALISKPVVCKIIKYALLVDASGVSNQLNGATKMKYIGAKVTLGMANVLASKGNTILYDTCDCITWNGKDKRYEYVPNNNCMSPDAFKKQIESENKS